MMKRHMAMSSVLWVAAIVASTATAEDPVTFVDEILKVAVEEALGVVDPTPTQMAALTSLDAGISIVDLTGLEYAVNLETLSLNDNRITDLAPLSGLGALRSLDISDNYVLSDLSGLSGLSGLEHLDLHRNGISDVGSLSGLTGLRTLVLRNNNLSDVGPLGGLTGLEMLNVQVNQIRDISALTNLTGLLKLDLSSNSLNEDAYCTDLQKVFDNNPGIELWYEPNPRPPTGVLASDGTYADRVQITWDGVCDGPYETSRYRVYRGPSASGPKTPISGWQMEVSFDDTTALSGTTYTYWVQADPYGDGSGATGYSDPDTGWR